MVAYSFKKRFIEPIRVGLSTISLSFDCPPKRQTIRALGKRRHARRGETLQLYTAMRTRQCRKIGDARCVKTDNITLRICSDGDLLVTIGGKLMLPADVDGFAQDDGFEGHEDMWLFWRENHPDTEYFNGVLILWEPL